MNFLLPPAAIIAGIYFVTGLPVVFSKAAANSLMSVEKAKQMVDGVRFGGILLVASGLVATVYNLAHLS